MPEKTSDDDGDESKPIAQPLQLAKVAGPISQALGVKFTGLDFGLNLPKFDFGLNLPKFDFGLDLPKFDFGLNLPQLDLGFALPNFDFLKDFGLDLTRGIWPENLEHLNWDQEFLYRLTVDEGLPVAYVPRAETMTLVFAAETAAQRRAVYGRRWRGIIEDCQELADKMDSTWVAPYMRYLQSVIDAMRDGHYLAAQSLAASTLDTVAYYLDHSTWQSAKYPEKVDEPGDLPVRTFFAWSQLAGIYRRYFRDKNDPLPATFNRHGASHGVWYRQYSRLNATLGMAHLTSLMWIIDSETRNSKKRPPRPKSKS